MNFAWILSDAIALDPTLDIKTIKQFGSLWGSWRTWRSCQTDNVICHDLAKASDLIKRDFQHQCNFYIPNSFYMNLERPNGVKIYQGEFLHEVDNREEIVALHLAASANDIVLLLGFDFSEPTKSEDRLLEHKAHNYRSLVKQVIKSNPKTQWVLIDHPKKVMLDYQDLENLTCDRFESVLQLLG